MKDDAGERQLAHFIAKYTPAIGAMARAVVARMRARLPHAVVLVYDNYNALAIGFGPTERASEAIFSIAVFPRWVSLFFLQGAKLADPQKLLKGSGSKVRHIVLNQTSDLDQPGVKALMAQALERATHPIDGRSHGRMVLKSISAKQRPRRPRP
jgi:hypothetical protein